YSSDAATNASNAESLVHTPLTGKNAVTLAAEGGRDLSTDATYLYYRSIDGKSLRRVLKAGGTPETFLSDASNGFSFPTVSGTYVYFVQAKTVKRLATTFTP